MKLYDIIKYPCESLAYMERYVNDGSPSGFTWLNTTSKMTEPRSSISEFHLFECYAPSGIMKSYGDISIKLDADVTLIHPDMRFNDIISGNASIYQSKYLAMPTSSGRTVKISNDRNVYVKLHYDGIIGRVNRKITRNHALSGLETTFLLYDALDDLCMPSCFTFLPEIGCKILRFEHNDSFYEFGTVFRDTVPYGQKSEDIKIIIPLFSLLSKDLFRPEDEELINQIIKYSGFKPYEYIMEKIIKPIIHCYFTLIINFGLQPEWHGQNILLGFNDQMSKVYIIARDLDSVDKDLTIMKNLKMNTNFMSFPYKCLDASQYNYKIKHSFMFDHKIGEYIIDPLIKYMESNYKIPFSESVEEIRCFVDLFLRKLPHDFFPDKYWYKFDDVIVNQDVRYRPYIAIENPRYRRVD